MGHGGCPDRRGGVSFFVGFESRAQPTAGVAGDEGVVGWEDEQGGAFQIGKCVFDGCIAKLHARPPRGQLHGRADHRLAGEGHELGVPEGAFFEVCYRGIEHNGLEVCSPGGDEGDGGCAEAGAEEDDAGAAAGVLGAELVEDGVEVIGFADAAGGGGAARLAVCAEVGQEEVVAEVAEQRCPGECPDFGVGVSVDEDGEFGRPLGWDHPGGDFEPLFDLELEAFTGHAKVLRGDASESVGGFTVGHSGRGEEYSGVGQHRQRPKQAERHCQNRRQRENCHHLPPC